MGKYERYNGSDWEITSDGTVTSITAGTGLTGGTITESGTIAIEDDVTLPGTGAVTIPVGTTAQRPTNPVVGMMRFNTDL